MKKIIAIIILFTLCLLTAFAQDQLEKARNDYLKKIRSKPEDLQLHREMMHEYKDKGLIKIPISIYEESAKKFPDNHIVSYVLGYAYLIEGSTSSLSKAKERLELAIKLKPDFVDAISALGDYHYMSGNDELAMERWKEAKRLDPNFAPAYLSIANFYRSRREFQKAIEEYEDILSTRPKRPGEIYLQMGLTYIDMNDLDNAEKALLQAKSYLSKNGMVYYKLGQIYAKRKERDKAIDMYRQGRKYDPNNAQVAYELANIFLENGDLKYAILSFERGFLIESADNEASKKIVELTDRGVEHAISYLNQLADSKYSSNFALLYFLGKIYAKLKKDELALKYLESASKLTTTNADVHYQIGLLYERLYPKNPAGQIEQRLSAETPNEAVARDAREEPHRDAQEQYRRAVELGAEEAELLYKVAKGYLEEGQEGKFIEVAEKALSINPNNVELHLQLARIYQKRADIYRNEGKKKEEKENLDKAIKHYEKVTTLEPSAQRWYNLGLLYELYGEAKAIKAYKAYDQAIQLDPNFARAYYQRGAFMLNYKVGPAKVLVYKPEDAIEDLKKALELDPNLADAHVALGLAYYQMDNPELATKEFEKAVEIDPKNVRARILLSQDYASAQNYQKVIEHLLAAAEVDENNFDVLKTLGGMLLKYGTDKDVPKAREVLEKAIKLKPDDAEVQMNYGYTLYLDSMFSSAIEHLNKALELQPNYPEAHYNIALAYSRIGEHKLAQEHWETVIKLVPQSPLASKSKEFLEKLRSAKN